MALFAERGYAATTTAAIAARAGLTERTFFRHFADKKDVLFGNEAMLQAVLVQGTLSASPLALPFAAARVGLRSLCQVLQPGFSRVVRRERIIANSPELRERELCKVRAWSDALRDALQERGSSLVEAEITAETVVGLLRHAYLKWATQSAEQQLDEILAGAFEHLDRLVRGDPSPTHDRMGVASAIQVASRTTTSGLPKNLEGKLKKRLQAESLESSENGSAPNEGAPVRGSESMNIWNRRDKSLCI